METVVTVEDKGSKAKRASSAVEPGSAEERALARAARLAEDLAAGWRRGEPPRAEDLLATAAELAAFPHAALLVVREEVRLRREHGPQPEAHEYRRRFPQWTADIDRLFNSHGSYGDVDGSVLFPTVGESTADCLLVGELGQGAQGRVFLATQPSLADRLVVLKMGPRDCHEHLALARLLHTHIVPLHFVQDLPVRNLRVLCMPYLGGATLAHLRDELKDKPVAARTGRDLLNALDRIQASRPAAGGQVGPARSRLAASTYVEAVCRIGVCLADALQYAHERRMLHLDLKPSNVLLAGDAQPLLLDFHLARPPLEAGALAPGWFGGTPGYMSPEQRLALAAVKERRPIPVALDGRADLFSLGVVLFEMLGGQPLRALKSPRQALRSANREVSPGLADVIAKCLDPDPRRRYQEAGALADDLRRHLAHLPLQVAPNRSLLERWRKWRRREPHALARGGMLLLLALLVVAAVGLGVAYCNHQRREAEAALAEGDGLLRRGLPAEAERSLARGEELVGAVPWSIDLADAFAAKRQEVRRAQLAGELHRTADGLRFLCDPDALSAAGAAELNAACRRLWDARQDLAGPDEKDNSESADAVRTDLRDLAVLWVSLRERAPGSHEAANEELAVLDEAEAMFGPSPVLGYERARFRPAAGADDLPPRTAWDHYALARVLLDDGKTEQAAAELEQAVAQQPQGFWPNFYEGVCAYRRSLFPEAEASFRVCVALHPETAPCYYNHGLAQAALGRADRARADYDRALQLDVGMGAAWLNRGVLNYQQKREDEALNDLLQALAHGADPAAVHYNLALTRHARREDAEARAEARAALQARPDHAGARELLAQITGR